VRFIDLHKIENIESLTRLLRNVSRATDPKEVLSQFSPIFRKMRPSDLYVSASIRGLEPGQYKITRKFTLEDLQRSGDPTTRLRRADPWRDWDKLPTYTGGLIGEIISRGEPSLIRELDLDEDPALGDSIKGMRACLANPHYDNGEPINWAISFIRDPDGYDPSVLEEGLLIGNLVGSITRNLIAIREARDLNEQLKAQFEEVARVQRSLLPSRIPDIPGLEIATSYLTSNEAGGDYYDFFPFSNGTWGIIIADVAGHGAGAATVMAMLRAILHAYPDSHDRFSPDDILAYTNRRLHAAGIDGRFVTAFCAVYDPTFTTSPNGRGTATLTYARSGHNPPLLKEGSTGDVRVLDGAGTVPLGVFEEYTAHSACIELLPGDTIVLYTDGITEAFDTAREMFGVHRLEAALTTCSGRPECVVDSVHSALFKHTGRMSREDDQTLVTFQFMGDPSKAVSTAEVKQSVAAPEPRGHAREQVRT
jgi:sigma-B regulation protein RsbU (phosphoserine phosphatase)